MCLDCGKVPVGEVNEKATQESYGQAVGTIRKRSHRESLMHRLLKSNEEGEKLNKAVRILEQHAEFEDLIWLIQSGLV